MNISDEKPFGYNSEIRNSQQKCYSMTLPCSVPWKTKSSEELLPKLLNLILVSLYRLYNGLFITNSNFLTRLYLANTSLTIFILNIIDKVNWFKSPCDIPPNNTTSRTPINEPTMFCIFCCFAYFCLCFLRSVTTSIANCRTSPGSSVGMGISSPIRSLSSVWLINSWIFRRWLTLDMS